MLVGGGIVFFQQVWTLSIVINNHLTVFLPSLLSCEFRRCVPYSYFSLLAALHSLVNQLRVSVRSVVSSWPYPTS